jgi:hypothetical protein
MPTTRNFDGPDEKYRERLAKSTSSPGSDPLDVNEIRALEQGYEDSAKQRSLTKRGLRQQATLLYTPRSSNLDVYLDSLPLPDAPPDPPVEPKLTGTSGTTFSGDSACVSSGRAFVVVESGPNRGRLSSTDGVHFAKGEFIQSSRCPV